MLATPQWHFVQMLTQNGRAKQCEFRLRPMPVRPDIGTPVGRDEEPLHEVRRGLVPVEVSAFAGRGCSLAASASRTE